MNETPRSCRIWRTIWVHRTDGQTRPAIGQYGYLFYGRPVRTSQNLLQGEENTLSRKLKLISRLYNPREPLENNFLYLLLKTAGKSEPNSHYGE